MNNPAQIKFAFFGSSRLSIIVLDELAKRGIIPGLIISGPDKPKDRGHELHPNIVKEYALKNNIPVESPIKLDSNFIEKLTTTLKLRRASKSQSWDIFLVASYGKIIPKTVIELPTKGSLNIHPSLLPKYRGPSPLPSTILDDQKRTGVTIMKMDEQMDHGPIVAQKEILITEWPTYEDYEEMMAREGARLFADTITEFISGNIELIEQDHAAATFTKKIVKDDALLNLSDDAYLNFRKIQAFHEWPQAFFFLEHRGRQIRVKVTEAVFESGQLQILRVIPEGGKEMGYTDFKRGYGVSAK